MTATDILQTEASEAALSIFAPAKVNLYLEVTGVRDDGYHTINSLMGFLDLGDEVRLQSAGAVTLSLGGPYAGNAPADESNLALRALRLLEERTGRALSVSIHIEKNIPAGAGLGGGSADAAAVLRGARQLFDLDLSDENLAELGLALGADVPACLGSVPVIAKGIGERLRPAVSVPDLYLVLVHPGVSLSTPDVYKSYDRSHTNCSCCGGSGHMFMPISQIDAIAQRSNDLENAAIELEPIIVSVLGRLSETTGCQLARMSGSGTACFGIYGSEDMAKDAAAELRQEFPGWWVHAARLAGSGA